LQLLTLHLAALGDAAASKQLAEIAASAGVHLGDAGTDDAATFLPFDASLPQTPVALHVVDYGDGAHSLELGEWDPALGLALGDAGTDVDAVLIPGAQPRLIAAATLTVAGLPAPGLLIVPVTVAGTAPA